MTQRQLTVASVLAGAVQVLGYAPLSWWPLSLAVLVLWLFAVRERSAPAVLLPAFAFGFGQYLAGVSWVFVSVHDYGGAPLWLACMLVVALASYLALFSMLALGLAWVLGKTATQRAVLSLPACWLLVQHGRDLILGGFPWLSTGYQAVDIPGSDAWLALVGVQGLGLLWWLVAGCGSLVLQKKRLPALPIIGLLALLWFVLPASTHWTHAQEQSLDVALVQGNIAQDQKWLPENLRSTLEMYTGLTEAQTEADLVIWPEVAIPAAYAHVQPWFEKWQSDAQARQQVVLAGVITRDQGSAYNTVYALGAQPGRYVKQHLVPFGEYFPVPAWVRPILDWLDLPFSDIRTDLKSARFLYAKDIALAMSICFEDVFPAEFAENAAGSGILVNVTNDAWFAGSLAPAQHFQIARARAAENGRVLLRVANTGISAVIDPQGGVSDALAWGERGVLTATVEGRTGSTPYMRFRDWPLTLLAMLVVLGLSGRHLFHIFSSHPAVPKHN